MSFKFNYTVAHYINNASQCTPEALKQLTTDMYRDQLRQLSIDEIFEALRSPIHNLHQNKDIFSISNNNVFFFDMLNEEVLSSEEVRQRYHNLLLQKGKNPEDRNIIWMILNAYSHNCHALMHLSRTSELPGYTVHSLFVSHVQIQDGRGCHEALLLTLMAFADIRAVELRVSCLPTVTLSALMLSMLGFMRNKEEKNLLVRMPIQELINSQQLFKVIHNQMFTSMHTLWSTLVDDKTADCMQNTAVEMPPCDVNKKPTNPPHPVPLRKHPRENDPETIDESNPGLPSYTVCQTKGRGVIGKQRKYCDTSAGR